MHVESVSPRVAGVRELRGTTRRHREHLIGRRTRHGRVAGGGIARRLRRLRWGHRLVPPGAIENVTTRGIALLELATGTLRLGAHAVVEVTGLRNPCSQLDGLAPGLMEALIERTPDGLVRKAGVMGIVVRGGDVRPGDAIALDLPSVSRPMAPV